MLKQHPSTKRLLSLIMSLVFILSVTLICPPAVFAVEHTVETEEEFISAFSLAAAGDTISLSDDITLTQNLTLNKNININCSHHTIYVQSVVTISSGSITGNGVSVINVNNGGNLRIQQNANISGGAQYTIFVSSGGSLTMSGGNLTASIYGIVINEGTVDLSGGTITLSTTDIGIYVLSGRLEMSGGTIISTSNPNSIGVWAEQGEAVFTGGNIQTPYGVAIVQCDITSSVPAQQLGGLYDSARISIVSTSPAAITMQRGQMRTVTLLDADESFSLYPTTTSTELNAEDAGPRSATIRPLQAGSYTLSFLGMVGVEQAFITLNIPVTVTNPTSNNPGTPSTTTGQDDDPVPSRSVPSIPETGAGNLLQLLLLSVLCI